ncbi:MAG: gliding motility lipoprotein GldH [Chitinophagaceae bacterium]|nr:gliding motility lipoprotein GldH [Chitinophagaceae bacterium]
MINCYQSVSTSSSRKNAKHFIRDLYIFFILSGIVSCGTVDVFEKNISIPDHQWASSFKPEISFEITDTASLYNIYVVLRHTEAYRYKNIWLNAYIQMPGDTLQKQRLDLQLADDDKGWLGSGMDDIFEHRILITHSPQQFRKPGIYKFRLENIMREDPLQYVMNVGIRVEKAK